MPNPSFFYKLFVERALSVEFGPLVVTVAVGMGSAYLVGPCQRLIAHLGPVRRAHGRVVGTSYDTSKACLGGSGCLVGAGLV